MSRKYNTLWDHMMHNAPEEEKIKYQIILKKSRKRKNMKKKKYQKVSVIKKKSRGRLSNVEMSFLSACEYGNVDIVKQYFHIIHPKKLDEGITLACFKGHIQIVKILVKTDAVCACNSNLCYTQLM